MMRFYYSTEGGIRIETRDIKTISLVIVTIHHLTVNNLNLILHF